MASWSGLCVLLDIDEVRLQGVSDFIYAALIRVYTTVAPTLFSSSSSPMLPSSSAAASAAVGASSTQEIPSPLSLPEATACSEGLVQGAALADSEAQSSAHPQVVQQALRGDSLACQEGAASSVVEEMGGEERREGESPGEEIQEETLIEGEREDIGGEVVVSSRDQGSQWEVESFGSEAGCQAEMDYREVQSIGCQAEPVGPAMADISTQWEEESGAVEGCEAASSPSVIERATDQTERPAVGGCCETLQAGREGGDQGSAQKEGRPLVHYKEELSIASMLLNEAADRLEHTGTGADRVLVALIRSKLRSLDASLHLKERPLLKEPELPVFSTAPAITVSDALPNMFSDVPASCFLDEPSIRVSDALSRVSDLPAYSVSDALASSSAVSDAPVSSISDAPDSSLSDALSSTSLDAPFSTDLDTPVSSPWDVSSCTGWIEESAFQSPSCSESPRGPLDSAAVFWDDLPAEQSITKVPVSGGSCEWEDIDDSSLRGSFSQQQAPAALPVLQVERNDVRQSENRNWGNASDQGSFVSNSSAWRGGGSTNRSAYNPRRFTYCKNQNRSTTKVEPTASIRHAPLEEEPIAAKSRFCEDVLALCGAES